MSGFCLAAGMAISGLQGVEGVQAQEDAASDLTASVVEVQDELQHRQHEHPGLTAAQEPGFWDNFEWSLALDGIIQGNTGSAVWEDQADAVYGIDLDALYSIGDSGTAYAKIEAGGGEGVDGRIGTFSGFNDHTWGDDSIEVVEMWYEHSWCDGRYRGRIGKVDLTTDFDTNAYANCEHEQFISSGFINNLAHDMPDNTFGAMFWWQPSDSFSIGVGYQSTSGWDDIFDRGYGILEFGWHPVFNGHQGNYRFYGWAGSYDGYFDEDAGEEVDEYSNYGWGLSFDQEISAHLGVWCRYGWKPDEDYNPFDQHTSFGIQLMNFGCRTDDALGIAYGVASLSDSYASTLDEADDEKHIEVYYRAQINDYIAITPNLQWVDNAEGDAANDDVLVLGFRGVFML